MKTLNKLLSLFLVLVLLFSSFGLNLVAAEEVATDENITETEETPSSIDEETIVEPEVTTDIDDEVEAVLDSEEEKLELDDSSSNSESSDESMDESTYSEESENNSESDVITEEMSSNELTKEDIVESPVVWCINDKIVDDMEPYQIEIPDSSSTGILPKDIGLSATIEDTPVDIEIKDVIGGKIFDDTKEGQDRVVDLINYEPGDEITVVYEAGNTQFSVVFRVVQRSIPDNRSDLMFVQSDPLITVTYDANGGYFGDDPTKTTNEMTYSYRIGNFIGANRVSHYTNVDDDGNKIRDYDNGLNGSREWREVITLPGITSFDVTITWGGESASYDWVCMFEGEEYAKTASNNYSESITGKLGGGSHLSASNTKTYHVEGNAVTFCFRTDGSVVGDGYGYYAVINSLQEVDEPTEGSQQKVVYTLVDGEYSNDLHHDTMFRYGEPGMKDNVRYKWYTDTNYTTIFENLDEDNLTPQDFTVYARWSENTTWQEDYTYSLDTTNKVINLTKYKGVNTDVEVPAKAFINGEWYSTNINGGVYNGKTTIQNVTFEPGVTATSLSSTFSGCTNLKTVNLDTLDTTNLTTMQDTFNGCSNLQKVDVENLDTSKVTSLYRTFYGCSKLTDLKVQNWNTSNVTTLYQTFYNCSSLPSLDVADWNTAKVESLSGTFQSCSSLTDLPVGDWDTSKVSTFANTFASCSKLSEIDVADWNTGNATSLSSMFNGCTALERLDVSNFNTAKVTTFSGMFNNCKNLPQIDVSDWNTGAGTNMSNMFSGCSKIETVDVSNWNTENVTNFSSMFYDCAKLKTLDVSNFDTGKATNMSQMFRACPLLATLTGIEDFDTKNVTTTEYMFNGCSALTSLDLSSWNVEKISNMQYMFYAMSNLSSLNIHNWNPIAVTSLYYTFASLPVLTELDISDWNTPSLTNLSYAFSSNKAEIDVTNLNTSKVTNMSHAFSYTNGVLEGLDTFDTAKTTNMSNMFYSSGIRNIDVSGWNTAAVTNMASMFSNSKLENIDISTWDMSKVTSISSMLSASNLGRIVLGEKSKLKHNSNTVGLSGDWIRVSTEESIASRDLMTQYNASMADTYVKSINVQFFGEGGTVSKNYISCLFGDTVTELPTAEKEGFTFIGWYDDPKNGTKIDIGDKFLSSKYYAHYEPYHYTLILEPNGGEGERQVIELTYDDLYRLSSHLFTKEGSRLFSWNTKPTGTGKSYSSDETIYQLAKEDNEVITLYAQWNANDGFDVVFDANGGYFGNEETTQNILKYQYVDNGTKYIAKTMNFDYSGNYDSNTYVRTTGYNVLSIPDADRLHVKLKYRLSASNSGIVVTSDENANKSTSPSNSVYKKTYTSSNSGTWVTEEFDVIGNTASFYLYGADNSTNSGYYAEVEGFYEFGDVIETAQYPIRVSGNVITPTAPSDAYKFVGWFTEPESGTQISYVDIPHTEPTTYYAHWSKDLVVGFNFDNGMDILNRTIEPGKTLGTLPAAAKEEMTFIRWIDEDGNTVTASTKPTKNEIYTAIYGWAPHINLAGGHSDSTITYPIQDASNSQYTITELPETTRDGYVFAGWYHGDDQIEIGDTIDLSSNREITAHWEPENSYKITFTKVGRDGATPFGTSSPLTKVWPNKVGEPLGYYPTPWFSSTTAQFIGWVDENGNEITKDFVPTGDMTIYANYRLDERTIVFDAQGGSEVANKHITSPYNLKDIPGSNRQGYVLEGWYTRPNGAGDKLVVGEPVTATLYYANWVPETHENGDDDVQYIFGTSWTNASNNNVDNIDNNLIWHPQSTGTLSSILHMRFELNSSVKKIIPEGQIRVSIPKYIWEDWNGNKAGTNNLSINMPEYPNKRAGMYFSYIDCGDHYEIVNNQEVSGGAGVDLSITYQVNPTTVPGGAVSGYYDSSSQPEYVPGYEYYHGEYPITLTIDKDDNGVVDIEDTITLSNEIHTQAAGSLSKTKNTIYYEWSDSIIGSGTGYATTKPYDADNYFYVKWQIAFSGSSTTTQPYSLLLSEDTIHDGDVITTFTETPSSTSTGTTYFYVVTKHPKELLNNMPVVLNNTALINQNWKSGYQTQYHATAQTVVNKTPYNPNGEFAKNRSNSLTITGGQDQIVDENKEVSIPYSLIYSGGSNWIPTWDETNQTYIAREREIILHDGNQGDLMYSSGRAVSPYIWEPNTGNVVVLDSDYYISQVSISLYEYDARRMSDGWGEPYTSSNTTEFKGVEVYVRYRNTSDYVLYSVVYPKNNSVNVTFNDKSVVGIELRHKSKFFKTSLSETMYYKLMPTDHIKGLIKRDIVSKVGSEFKNQGYCEIYDYMGNRFFYATNRTSGSSTAEKALYELTSSKNTLRAAKSAAKQENIVLDVEHGYQDSPMVIKGQIYNDANRIKPLRAGTFYDLLPKGATVDTNTIIGRSYSSTSSINSDDKTIASRPTPNIDKAYYNVTMEENWEGTGQTMMIIDFSLPDSYTGNTVQFYYLLRNTYENIIENGTNVENDVAFVNRTKDSPLPDSRYRGKNELAHSSAYDNLESENQGVIAYDYAPTHYVPVDAFSWGFTKTVKTLADFSFDAVTVPNSDYIYRLSYSQSDYAISDSLVFYDVLESGSNRRDSEWQGTFKSIDVSSAASKLSMTTDSPCNPIIYYSTKDRDTFTELDFNVENPDVWSTTIPENKADITAVAVDCRTGIDGEPFILQGRQVINIYVTMVSPIDSQYFGKTAVNPARISLRTSGGGIPTGEPTFEKSEAEVTLTNEDPELEKISNPTSGTQEKPAALDKGDTLTYTLIVTNKNDVFPIEDVVVTDEIPEEVHFNTSDIKIHFGDPNTALPIVDSPRATILVTGRNIRVTILRMEPSEKAYIIIPTTVTTDGGEFENTSHIPSVKEVEKDITSDTVYHKVLPEYEISFHKKTINNIELPGATMRLTGRQLDATQDIEPITWVTGTDGNILGIYKPHVIKLKPGTYNLRETRAPAGYLTAGDIEFTIAEDGTITINNQTVTDITMTDVGISEMDISKTVTGNLGDKDHYFVFRIHFESSEGVPWANVIFKVTRDGNVQNVRTDTNGDVVVQVKHGEVAHLTGLPEGYRYVVTEEDEYYDSSSTNAQGILQLGLNEVAFVNDRNVAVPTEIRFSAYAGLILIGFVGIYFLLRRRRLD